MLLCFVIILQFFVGYLHNVVLNFGIVSGDSINMQKGMKFILRFSCDFSSWKQVLAFSYRTLGFLLVALYVLYAIASLSECLGWNFLKSGYTLLLLWIKTIILQFCCCLLSWCSSNLGLVFIDRIIIRLNFLVYLFAINTLVVLETFLIPYCVGWCLTILYYCLQAQICVLGTPLVL